ncbi:hypothetical protein [Nitratifractor salsuginis]|uniref:Transporter n=1 Tax=Nitratifractor salsuginis (strain DSM 16511 / JCM 12458 / E9I37-1) TaxID=749222 RepID=E6WYU0_NITSE|nr:hypothetical protein [Nitratifractor salsuginis]ADV46526.1 hypothetical protein Nitsa_1274 [Nitratifractor salsuginis DSM 16511]
MKNSSMIQRVQAFRRIGAICLSVLSLQGSLMAGQAGAAANAPAQGRQTHEEAELAKQLANPIATLISVPFQLNYDRGFFGTSGNDSNKWTLNIQPVIPFSLNEDWNVISRTILPVIRTDNYPLGSGIDGGVGDIVQSVFFSPKAPSDSGWIWGAGPVFLFPSGTEQSAKKWGAGPTAVALKQQGPWTYGILANHIWSYAGSDERVDRINQSFVQPFLTYTTPSALSATFMTESTYDWTAEGGERWSVPLYLTVSQVGKIGKQLVSYGGGVKYYAKSPDNGPKGWGVRLVFTLMFPK